MKGLGFSLPLHHESRHHPPLCIQTVNMPSDHSCSKLYNCTLSLFSSNTCLSIPPAQLIKTVYMQRISTGNLMSMAVFDLKSHSNNTFTKPYFAMENQKESLNVDQEALLRGEVACNYKRTVIYLF